MTSLALKIRHETLFVVQFENGPRTNFLHFQTFMQIKWAFNASRSWFLHTHNAVSGSLRQFGIVYLKNDGYLLSKKVPCKTNGVQHQNSVLRAGNNKNAFFNGKLDGTLVAVGSFVRGGVYSYADAVADTPDGTLHHHLLPSHHRSCWLSSRELHLHHRRPPEPHLPSHHLFYHRRHRLPAPPPLLHRRLLHPPRHRPPHHHQLPLLRQELHHLRRGHSGV